MLSIQSSELPAAVVKKNQSAASGQKQGCAMNLQGFLR